MDESYLDYENFMEELGAIVGEKRTATYDGEALLAFVKHLRRKDRKVDVEDTARFLGHLVLRGHRLGDADGAEAAALTARVDADFVIKLYEWITEDPNLLRRTKLPILPPELE